MKIIDNHTGEVRSYSLVGDEKLIIKMGKEFIDWAIEIAKSLGQNPNMEIDFKNQKIKKELIKYYYEKTNRIPKIKLCWTDNEDLAKSYTNTIKTLLLPASISYKDNEAIKYYENKIKEFEEAYPNE